VNSAQTKVKESIEEILQTILPIGKEAKTDFSKLDKQTLENSLQMLMPYQRSEENTYDLDARSKDAMDRLVRERFNGRYQNDKEGFAKAFLDFSENATYDKTKKINQPARFDINGSFDRE